MSELDDVVAKHVTENDGHVVISDLGWARCQATDCGWSNVTNRADVDPGPVPTDPPETPPLTLKQRIENTIERAMTDQGAEMTSGLFGQIVRDVHAVVSAGADWTPREEAIQLTPAQALAYLLDLPEWSRIERLGMLLDEADIARQCFELNHSGKIAHVRALGRQNERYQDALVRIARLCSTVDQPESQGQNVIGQIAAEALTPK